MLARGPNRVFVVSGQTIRPATPLTVSGEHYPAWHTYAGAASPDATVTPDPDDEDDD